MATSVFTPIQCRTLLRPLGQIVFSNLGCVNSHSVNHSQLLHGWVSCSRQEKARGTGQTRCVAKKLCRAQDLLTNCGLICNKRTMADYCGTNKDLIFRQLLDYKSYTYTYLLADPESKEAILIDPVVDVADRDVKIVEDLGLTLKYAINTHVHADHITGTGAIKQKVPSCKSVISEVSGAKADVKIKQGSELQFGKYKLEVRSTPGHTNGCVTYVFHEKGMAFTGDALLIRGCGRTDFQEGSSSTLYDSVHNQIFSLPENYTLFPAHDYTGQTSTTVSEEKKLNPRLTKTKEQFIDIMNNLNLPYPKQIDKALPANLVCGVFDA